jgi:hypothetical protein
MTKLITGFFLLFFCSSLKAQVKALTENGREVILNENGTWNYASGDTVKSNHSDSIITNPVIFHKINGATFLVKSNSVNVGVYLDPDKWIFLPHKDNQVNPEYTFQMKSQKGYAMILTEPTPIDIENMKSIALENAQKSAADAVVTHSEYRTVNNNKVLCLTMKATIKGIKFVYFGYYYSNSKGTTQLLSYGSEAMFKESFKDWQDFLNGFSVLN